MTLRCCTRCGRVLDEVTFSTEVTFSKGAGGESTVNGHFVSEAAASRGLGRISGGRLFGYQARLALSQSFPLFSTGSVSSP